MYDEATQALIDVADFVMEIKNPETFNREESLIMDEQENMKERVNDLIHQVISLQSRTGDLENEVAILKQHKVQADILLEVVKLRERVDALESSAHQ
jgi:hypothetical protein